MDVVEPCVLGLDALGWLGAIVEVISKQLHINGGLISAEHQKNYHCDDQGLHSGGYPGNTTAHSRSRAMFEPKEMRSF